MMKIQSIIIEDDFYIARYSFTDKNQIFSIENSQGKTTLIRFLIYALGYNVPITEKIQGERYKVTMDLQINKRNVRVIRKRNEYTIIDLSDNTDNTYNIKTNNLHVLANLYKINNLNILGNILGCHYIDQEYGWGVFNRGKIISTQHINIEQLLYGMSHIDESLFTKRKIIMDEIKKYSYIISISSEQAILDNYLDQNNTLNDTIRDTQRKLSEMLFKRKRHLEIYKSAKESLNDNNKIWRYIDQLKMTVRTDDGKRIKITKDNVEGALELDEYLNALMFNENAVIRELDGQIDKLQNNLNLFFSSMEVIKQFKIDGAKQLYHINIDEAKNNKKLLIKQGKSIDEVIGNELEKDDYRLEMDKNLLNFSEILGVKDILKDEMILNKEFKDNTGTKKQKLVLAYRFSMLKSISKHIKINLPIIMDSINHEMDKNNMKNTLNFISDEFSDHQIIISTICNLPKDYQRININSGIFIKKDSKNGKII